MTNQAIETDSCERIASDGVTIAFAWLAIGESVIPGWTFAAATSLEGQSLSQKCAGTLTSDDITKVGAGSRGLAIAG